MTPEQALQWADKNCTPGATARLRSRAAVAALADEVGRLQAEISRLRTGDTCARQCEGTAYRIEAQRWRAAALAEREACHMACRDLAKRMKTPAERDAANSCAEVIYMRSNAQVVRCGAAGGASERTKG